MIHRPRIAAVLLAVSWFAGAALAFGTIGDAIARVAFARGATAAGRLAVRGADGAPRRTITVGVLAPDDRAPGVLAAAGDLAFVRRALAPTLGGDTSRIGVEDRPVVVGSGTRRVVSQPVKDADDWDIVGASAVVVDPRSGAGGLFLLLATAALAGIGLAAIAIRSLTGGRRARAAILLAASVVPLVVSGTWWMRRLREMVAATPGSAAMIGDVTPVATPSMGVVGALLVLALLMITAGSMAAWWVASPGRRAAAVRETMAGWTFLAPSLAHVLAFSAGPLVFTVWVSLHRWDLLADEKPFVGVRNYQEMLGDPLFWTALRNTAVYAFNVPVTMALALAVALLLDQPLRGVRLLRTIVFLPYVVSYVAIAMVWQWIYDYDFGLLNFALRVVHLPPVDWLADPRVALPAIMLVSVWVQLGFQMVVYLAGLQGIPTHLREAARLDGASAWQRFRLVTLPLLRPVSVYLFVTGVIWSFQVFTLVYVMTEGGPVHATDVLVYQIYQNAWEFRRMGYASAMSLALFGILVALTVTQWRVLNRRVEHA